MDYGYVVLLCFVALFFLSLPFPYSILPNPADLTQPLFESVARFWAEDVFRLSGKYTIELISDSTGLYLHLITLGLMSGILGWVIARRGARAQRFIRVIEYIVLFFLVLHLAKYGFDKVFKHQFYFPEPNTQFTPLGYLSKDILYWSAIGSSHSYNVAMGIFELIPAALLLFRRTRLLGGLIALGVMTHIVVLNFSFDISVKVHSIMLCLSAGLIVLPWGRRLWELFVLGRKTFKQSSNQTIEQTNNPILDHNNKCHSERSRGVRNLRATIMVLLILTESLFPYLQQQRFNGDTANKGLLHGAYQVESIQGFSGVKRIFFHKDQYLIFQYQDDKMRDMRFRWGWGTEAPYLNLGQNGRLEQQWKEADSLLVLEGLLLGDSVKIVARKLEIDHLPIADDDFHWTIDYMWE